MISDSVHSVQAGCPCRVPAKPPPGFYIGLLGRHIGVLNHFTPMAYLPPETAYEATITAYVMVGSVGALIWDILMNVDSDYQLLFKYKITVPTVTYFLSRTSVLVYVLMNVICHTAALPNCQVIKKWLFSSSCGWAYRRISHRGHPLMPYASAAPITFAANDKLFQLILRFRIRILLLMLLSILRLLSRCLSVNRLRLRDSIQRCGAFLPSICLRARTQDAPGSIPTYKQTVLCGFQIEHRGLASIMSGRQSDDLPWKAHYQHRIISTG
ncbi:hypothetical protein LshimejAT787_1102160 [Lyophyllum shimeji]|uniref:Uncharacterized protein n=1 Tax=Lyophyllum shimeji TaxID=47721 RepID=A0A9P3PV27_LYOSH|nr:hypothetical protein LshimejAT787_1102160 [Lyophyllum shimeji]